MLKLPQVKPCRYRNGAKPSPVFQNKQRAALPLALKVIGAKISGGKAEPPTVGKATADKNGKTYENMSFTKKQTWRYVPLVHKGE